MVKQIVKQAVSDDVVSELIETVRKKKELQGLSRAFVHDAVLQYLQKNPAARYYLEDKHSVSSEKYKQIVKHIRASLRRIYGLFRVADEMQICREKLELMEENPALWKELGKEIMTTQASTKERLTSYEELYDRLFSITGKPSRIIDLGCGINPLSLAFMDVSVLRSGLRYDAYDISVEEIELLNRFFHVLHQAEKKCGGSARILDATSIARLSSLHQADICFLFKMTDVLDQSRGHKVTELVMQRVPARFVVVSFPTRTMSGKKMNVPRRPWMEWLCKRLGYEYQILEFPNEIFYVVRKG